MTKTEHQENPLTLTCIQIFINILGLGTTCQSFELLISYFSAEETQRTLWSSGCVFRMFTLRPFPLGFLQGLRFPPASGKQACRWTCFCQLCVIVSPSSVGESEDKPINIPAHAPSGLCDDV